MFDGATILSSNIEDFDPHYTTVINDNTLGETSLYVDGQYIGGLPPRDFKLNNIGRGGILSLKGKMVELVSYTTDQSVNRAVIESTINR